MMTTAHPFRSTLAAAVLLTALAGCKREAAPSAQPATPSATLPAEHPPLAPAGGPRQGLGWTLPKGWTQTPGSGMRLATLKPPASGNVDVSVVPLSGAAGGELANVNRWRGQLGLAPVDEKALAKLRQTTQSPAGKVLVFDFTGESAPKVRMVAGYLPAADGDSWFFKMTGDAEPVGQAKAEFLVLLGSLRLDK